MRRGLWVLAGAFGAVLLMLAGVRAADASVGDPAAARSVPAQDGIALTASAPDGSDAEDDGSGAEAGSTADEDADKDANGSRSKPDAASGPSVLPPTPMAAPTAPTPSAVPTPPGVPSGVPSVPSGLPQPPSGLPSVPAGLPSPPAGVPSVPGGLPSGLPQPPAGLPNVPAGLPQPPAGLPSLPGGLPQPPAGLPNVPAGLPNVPAGLPTPPAGLPNVPAGLPNVPAGLPAPALPGGLPTPAGLPNVPAGLPAPALPGGLPAPALPGGLPAPALPGGLPAPPAGLPAGLPSPPAGLPAGLPSPPAGLPAGLPSPPAGLPLPATGAPLPDAGPPAGLPDAARPAGVPAPVEGVPAPPAVEAPAPPTADAPTAAPASAARPTASEAAGCTRATRSVRDSAGLTQALAAAKPGDVIALADGQYRGSFIARAQGATDRQITLCGTRNAVLTGSGGYPLHLDGAAHWRLAGFTIRGGQKGLMADHARGNVVEGLLIEQIGQEGLHLRSASTDNVIRGNEIRGTGRTSPEFGEGIYVGSAHKNWAKFGAGGPDRSDRNLIERNTITDTTAECVDIKEGTTGGTVRGNTFSGRSLIGGFADSWVDVKGNGWTVVDNVGSDLKVDPVQVHQVVPGWGLNNRVANNRTVLT